MRHNCYRKCTYVIYAIRCVCTCAYIRDIVTTIKTVNLSITFRSLLTDLGFLWVPGKNTCSLSKMLSAQQQSPHSTVWCSRHLELTHLVRAHSTSPHFPLPPSLCNHHSTFCFSFLPHVFLFFTYI